MLQTWVHYWVSLGLLAYSKQKKCIAFLSAKFPDSPRVDCLSGIYIEATESPESALRYYEKLLEKDESNAVS